MRKKYIAIVTALSMLFTIMVPAYATDVQEVTDEAVEVYTESNADVNIEDVDDINNDGDNLEDTQENPDIEADTETENNESTEELENTEETEEELEEKTEETEELEEETKEENSNTEETEEELEEEEVVEEELEETEETEEELEEEVEETQDILVYDMIMKATTTSQIISILTNDEYYDYIIELSDSEVEDIAIHIEEVASSRKKAKQAIEILADILGIELVTSYSVVDDGKVTFDLAYGDITFSDAGFGGYNSDGDQISGEHDPSYSYYITQSNSKTNYTISVGTENTPVTEDFEIHLCGVNIEAPKTSDNHKAAFYVNNNSGYVYIIIDDNTTNTLKSYGLIFTNGSKSTLLAESKRFGHAAIEKEIDTKGTLVITCEEGYDIHKDSHSGGHDCSPSGSCGELDAYSIGEAGFKGSNTRTSAAAAIGSKAEVSDVAEKRTSLSGAPTMGTLHNLRIVGGIITATGSTGNYNTNTELGGSPGIGVGAGFHQYSIGYATSSFRIYGGYINAIAGGGSSACIGGGYHAGEVNVAIYGGTIFATEKLTASSDIKRGAGIGGGGGGSTSNATAGANVYIRGGTVYAHSEFGAAIGSGAGGSSGIGQTAYVEISDGEVYATTTKSTGNGAGAAIGSGGSTGTGKGGKATVKISGGSIEASSELGADIGGGGTNSTNTSGVGGEATVEITGGNILAMSGGIGGGNANAGVGGNAKLTISGGTINASKVSGGNSVESNGGRATVTITDGVINTGTIGGGASASSSGHIGSAEVTITGGKLYGQIIMDSTDLSSGEKCFFKMSGGTIDGTYPTNGLTFNAAYDNGAAVYIIGSGDSEEAIAQLSGGTIKNCDANNGGAVYIAGGGSMLVTGGTIDGCVGYENGGAIYIDGGTFTMDDGSFTDCSAVNGGAIYIKNGSVFMNGGSIEDCVTSIDGGAVYVSNGDITINGGEISRNSAGYGGALFTKGGNVVINHGMINDNEAIQGGAIYISGTIDTYLKMRSGEMSNNTASDDGGAIYITSGNLLIGVEGCLGIENENDDHLLNNLGKHHPIIHNNKAGDCGGGVCIVNEGAVHFYCGSAIGNAALYKGVGKNIFMDGGEFYFYDGTNVGVPRDPDLVIIGGELHNECTNVKMIKISYSRTNERADDEYLEGLAELNEYINLPDAEYFWEGEEGYRFIGWTAYGYNSTNESNVVRDKGDYKPSGMSIQISDTAAIGGKQNTFDGTEDEIMHLYALWAPSTNNITYMDSLRFGVNISNSTGNTTPNTYQVKETDYTITIKPAEVDMIKPGFEVVGWWIYQDQAVNGNWCELDSNGEYKAYEPVYKTKTKADTNLNLARDGSGMKYYKLASPNSDLKLTVSELTFGDIVLIADYQLSYGELEIESGQLADVDQHQGIIYNIKSKNFDAVENSTGIVNTEILAEIAKLSQIELNISSLGETKVIKGLPTGTYTVDCNTDWNWRYTATDKEVYVGKHSQIAYSFIRKIKQWIDFNTLYTDIL